jgi:hypothetical protein
MTDRLTDEQIAEVIEWCRPGCEAPLDVTVIRALASELVDRRAAEAAHQATGDDLVKRLREAGKAMDHAANEWADTASNAFQWIKNIRDGISTPPSALANLEECFAHCRSVWSTARAEMDKP